MLLRMLLAHQDHSLWDICSAVDAGFKQRSAEYIAYPNLMPLRFSRGRAVLVFTLFLLATVGAAFFWHKTTPPLAARLLPESEAIVYANLSPLRAATRFHEHPVPHSHDYQQFIDATGIEPERDLDEAAFALDRLPDLTGPNAGLGYSEVFRGRFDSVRLARYLASIAGASEQYDGKTIYAIPSEGRTVRVALLSNSMVAVSNTPTPEQIHSILDRARASWVPLGQTGPTLLARHYRDLPALSLAWGLGQIGLPFNDHGALNLFGLTLPFRLDATFIASLRWTGALRLRVEEIAPTETAAQLSAKGLSGLLDVGRFAENNLPEAAVNPGARAFLNSAKVTEYNDRAVLTATLPEDLLRSLLQAPKP